MERRRNYSNVAVIFGVLIMALVAGVTMTAYNAERSLFGEVPISDELAPISALTQELSRFELLAMDLSNGGPRSPSELDDRLFAVSRALEDLEGSGSAMQDPRALEFAQATRAWLENAQETVITYSDDPARLRAIAIEAHQILDTHSHLFDEELLAGYTQSASIIAKLRQSTYRSLLASFVTMVLALMGMAYFMRLSANNQALAERNERLASRAYSLNDAKSRLLTTLSHELRTPLNGILGLSGILLESNIKADDKVMVEQIRDSALDVTQVVGDMLEFTDFATIGTDPSDDVIFSYYLFQEIERNGHKLAREFGKTFCMDVSAGVPKLFRGDYLRLVRSFDYLTREVFKNAPNDRFVMSFDADDDKLIFKSDFEFLYGFDSDWQVEFISQPQETDPDRIMSQGLDGTMGRALLDTMGADIRVLHSDNDPKLHRLLIEVPIHKNLPNPLRVAKAEDDHDLPAAFLSALSADPLQWVESVEIAHVIFANYQSHARAKIENLRALVGNVTIIGVGQFADDEAYDYVINEPNWHM